jgi:hypothetical protein
VVYAAAPEPGAARWWSACSARLSDLSPVPISASEERLEGQLFTVFTLHDDQIVQLRDRAHRADALVQAGLDFRWH